MTELQFPANEAAITAEWLTGALSARFPGAKVSSATLIKKIGGTADKLRYQLDYADRGQGDPPPSLWVKGGFDPKGAVQGEAFANEVRFFLDLAPVLPINLPDCYYGAIEPTTRNGVVVLEDLINRPATFGAATQPLTADEAARVLSLQARYHAIFWDSDAIGRFGWLKAGGAMAGANMVEQYFGLWDGSVPLPRFESVPQAQRDMPRVRDALARLMRSLQAEANCLVHGDSHPANLFFDPDGTPGYLDWQHVMRGCWAFDLANFMVTAFTIEDRRANERALIAHYLAELTARGVSAPTFDQAWAKYRRYVMWPFMWVMCPPDVHPEQICTLNTARACAAIEDLGTLEAIETGPIP